MILIGLVGFLSDLRCHSPIIQIHWSTIGSMLSCTLCFSLTACIEESLPASTFINTAMAWWTSFSKCVMWHVRRSIPHWCHCCLITAAAKPGICGGGVTPDWCARARVLKKGGATRAAAVATCALILVHGGVLIGAVVFCSRTAHCFWKLSPLAESVGKLTDHWSAVQCNWGSWKPFDALP